jgi:hypothetical protein
MTDQNKDQNQDQNQNDQNQNRNASDKGGEKMIPKSRFDEVNAKKKEAEAELASVADGLTEEVPEEYRDMIPELAPAAKIKWLRAATAKGLFSKAPPEAPDSKRPNSKQTEDLTGLSPQSLMARGYGKK